MVRFLREVYAELLKVVWPKFDEFRDSTIVVLFLVGVFTIYLGGLGFVLSQLAQYVFRFFSA